LKIALVESNRFHARIIEQAVREILPDTKITIFSSGGVFLKGLEKELYDIGLISLDLPDVSSRRVIERVTALVPEMPLIVTSPVRTEEKAMELLKLGATDFIYIGDGIAVDLSRAIEEAMKKRRSIMDQRRRKAQKQRADRLNIINTLVSTLKHEIKNPLMSILGNIELLQDEIGSGDRDTARKLDMIEDSARRIQDIVEHLSSLARTEVKETPVGPMLRLRKSLPRQSQPVS